MRRALTLPRLYAILDVEAVICRGWSPLDVCQTWLEAGVRLIQLRAKSTGFGEFLELADACGALCGSADALCLINDRADVAALSGAGGVHVGQDDLGIADARQLLGLTAIVGRSTHTTAQVAEALSAQASYVATGPVFSTKSKDTGCSPRGIAGVRATAPVVRAAGVPLVAIGGITLDRAPEVLTAGADAVAVIGGLIDAPDFAGVQRLAATWVAALK